MEFDASELRTLAADLGKAGYDATRKAQQVVRKSALDVQTVAAEKAPVDTGFLKASIGVDMAGDDLTAIIGPSASYGRFVEEGTSRMAPQPYMSPALDAVTPGFVAAMEQLGGDIL